MFGATRFTNSSHLLAIEGSKFVKPVRLPPGRAKLWTTPADWIADLHKYCGRRAGGIPDRDGDGRRIREDHVRPQIKQLFGELARRHYIARSPAIKELTMAALRPAQGVKGLLENHAPRLSFWIIRDSHQHASPPHAIRLLRAGSQRPGCRPAQKDHELSPLHV